MIMLSMLLAACGPSEQSTRDLQAQKAEQAAQQIDFNDNAEIDNIKRRLELTSQPGLMGYILLLNDAGQPIMYTTTKGKVTSGSKRLTRTEEYYCDRFTGSGLSGCDFTSASSDEGTFGSSNPYTYFWTTSGQYVQWSGTYLYSDKPFRLDIKPLVVNIE